MSAESFRKDLHDFKDDLTRRGARSGPCFKPDGCNLIWYDQIFEREIEPAGAVNCSQALRVGATLNSHEVVLVASHGNEGPLVIPAGSTITLNLAQGDYETGTFADVGPTVCVKAPAEGMEIAPDNAVCRFALPDFNKPWLKVSLEFSGAITGGKMDCGLAYVPR